MWRELFTRAFSARGRASEQLAPHVVAFIIFKHHYQPPTTFFLADRIESLLEPTRMGFLGARECFEPLGCLFEPLFARDPGEAGIHLGVLVGFARDRGLQIQWS